MDKKYGHLLAFFYNVLNGASRKSLPLYMEFLDEIKADKEKIQDEIIEDEDLKDVLKDIEYSKRIKKALKEFEPPDEAKDRVTAIMGEASKAIAVFFEPKNTEYEDVVLKAESDSYFDVFVKRKFFKEDPRMACPDDAYKFHFSCFYRKETGKVEVKLSVSVNVIEKEIMGMTSENFTVFDEFAAAMGFSNAINDKRVYFDAIIEEGVTYEDNPCNVEWRKDVKP
jgi:hypothetical protein